MGLKVVLYGNTGIQVVPLQSFFHVIKLEFGSKVG
jgi:hypothetical protein